MTLPNAARTFPANPGLLCTWYHWNGVVAMPYRSCIRSQPMHMASMVASGYSVRRYLMIASTEASLPMFPEPRRPNRPTRGRARAHESRAPRPGTTASMSMTGWDSAAGWS